MNKNYMNAFYESLKDITFINEKIDEKRAKLKAYIDDFGKSTQNIAIDPSLKKQNEPLYDKLKATLSRIQESQKKSKDKFNQMIEQEAFRSELENKFIIIIFGKVKAGKSTLGNFIAKHRLPDQKLAFSEYDQAGQEKEIKQLEEIDDDAFATNNLECTSSIQLFKLDGMAWVDTPGLGSMTKENGDLAKDYIQSADYIIYPTSSDAPLQNDEKAQIKELFDQHKTSNHLHHQIR